ncbi:MAG TPA: hypothetical protein VMV72_13950 [Verrucomicrobiae bacterium]|nr:hypothetical protein [Verrucomicrobiae bacterium]
MKRHGAFSLTELLVLVPILALSGGLVLATLNGAQQTFQGAACLSNLREWGQAFAFYANDYQDYVPHEGGGVQPIDTDYNINAWFNVLPSYIGNPPLTNLYNAGKIPVPGVKSVFMCPALVSSNLTYTPSMANPFFAYQMNRVMTGELAPCPHNLYKRSIAVLPNKTVLMCDGDGSSDPPYPFTDGGFLARGVPRHNGGDNFVFVDGHADWVAYAAYFNPTIPPGSDTMAGTEWARPRQIYWFPCRTCNKVCSTH